VPVESMDATHMPRTVSLRSGACTSGLLRRSSSCMHWGPMAQQPGASSCAGLLGSTRTAYKPGSVGRRIALTVIPLGMRSPAPSSSLPAASWSRRTASRRLFGLAPTGVCRAVIVAADAVGSYPTFSPLPTRMQAVCFLWHFPSRLRRGALVPRRYLAVCPRSPDFPR